MFKASGTLSAWFKGSGRKIRADNDYSAAKEWSEESNIQSILSHPLCKRFQTELRMIDSLSIPELKCYRGRTPPFIDDLPPTSNQMGPPKPENTTENGRYNLKGFPALYLCDSIMGIKLELEDRKEPIWVQNYILPPTNLKIADLRKENISLSPFINCVFWFTEFANKDGNPTFIFSQTVAQIVKNSFEAMIVPGVRGTDEYKYNNIVIFEPKSIWMDWIENKDPYKVD
jgi:hypothetical protein